MRRTSRIIALLMAFQATVAWSVPTGVLCLSADGHVALESPNSACCHSEEHEAETESRHVITSSLEDCCGPCVDITLVTAPPALKSGEQAGLAPPASAVVFPASSCFGPPTPNVAVQLTASLPPAPTALKALRTVVLTC